MAVEYRNHWRVVRFGSGHERPSLIECERNGQHIQLDDRPRIAFPCRSNIMIDPAWTIFQPPSACCFCNRPTWLAFVIILIRLFRSKNVTYWPDARICLAFSNAARWTTSSLRNSFFVDSNGQSGVITLVISLRWVPFWEWSTLLNLDDQSFIVWKYKHKRP